MANNTNFKKTGYEDIDNLFAETEALLKRGEKLKRQIEDSLNHKLISPIEVPRRSAKKYRMYK